MRIKEHAETRCQLIGVDFDFGADPELANQGLKLMPGRFAVEMCPAKEYQSPSGLVMVMRDPNMSRPDAGIVIAVAPSGPIDRFTGRRSKSPVTVTPGQAVIVDHARGHRLDAAVFGAYEATEEVRVHGSVVMNRGYAKSWPQSGSILMVESPEGLFVTGGKSFAPDSEWILVARDGVIEKTHGGIMLPDSAKRGGLKGTIVDAGSRCFGPEDDEDGRPEMLRRGQRILYVSNLTKRHVRQIFGQGDDADRLCLIHIESVQGVLNEEVPDEYLNRMIAASENIVV